MFFLPIMVHAVSAAALRKQSNGSGRCMDALLRRVYCADVSGRRPANAGRDVCSWCRCPKPEVSWRDESVSASFLLSAQHPRRAAAVESGRATCRLPDVDGFCMAAPIRARYMHAFVCVCTACPQFTVPTAFAWWQEYSRPSASAGFTVRYREFCRCVVAQRPNVQSAYDNMVFVQSV